MYRAAYEEMDEAESAKLVSRMHELRELTDLESELLEMNAAEEFEIERQAEEARRRFMRQRSGAEKQAHFPPKAPICEPC
mmetsp:Transcript_61991/g.140256  ORF Transcript_61991/g.140256 Transcript_61991/m.140256 type:complete len:80 (-) Transcript_61991:58-297(-)